MSTSIIRGMYNRVMTRHHMGETEEMVMDAGIPAVVGFGLGYLGAKGKLDRSGVPMDALAGSMAMAGTIFTPLMAQTRDRIRQVAGVAIGVGMGRVGARAGGAAGTHGEWGWDIGDKFGQDPLVSAASRL